MKNRQYHFFPFLLATSMLFSGAPLMAQSTAKKQEKTKRSWIARLFKKDPQHKVSRDSKRENEAEYRFSRGVGFYIQENYEDAIGEFNKALTLSPKNAAIHYKLAESYQQLRQADKALEHAEAALSLDDKNEYYYSLLTGLLIENNRYARAVEVFEQQTEAFPEDLRLLQGLAILYLELGKNAMEQERRYEGSSSKLGKKFRKDRDDYFQKSIDVYGRLEEKVGLNEDVTMQKQQLYLVMGEPDKAIAEGDALVEAFPEEFSFKMRQIELLRELGKDKELEDYLKQAAEDHEDEPYPHLLLADLYKKQGRNAEAEQEMAKVFDNPKVDVDVKVQTAALMLQQVRTQESKNNVLDLALRIVEAHPDSPQAYSILGDAYYVNGEVEKARDAYLSSVKNDNTSRELIWQQLVRLDAELNQTDSLTSHAMEAAERFPEQGVFYLYAGGGYLMQENYESAVGALEKGKEVAQRQKDVNLEAEFYAQLGDAYNGLKKYDESDKAYDKALEFNPNNAHVLNNYSYFLSVRKDKLDKAKTMSEHLVRLYPDDPTYLDTYAWVLYMQKDFKKARKYLEKALLTSKDGTIIEHYGDVLFQLGETEAAVDQWKRAKEQEGTSKLIDKKIKDQKLYEE